MLKELVRPPRPARPWIERAARFGYGSKAAVYAVIGALTIAAGVHRGNGTPDRYDAIRLLARQPLGALLMIILALGLAGYAGWRILSAFVDSDRRGDDAKGFAIRAGALARGLFYAAFSVEVLAFVLRRDSGRGSDETARHWTARTLDHPFGRWIVAVVALSVLGYAAYQLSRAVRLKLSKQLHFDDLHGRARRWLVALCCFGIGARAIIFGVIGWSLGRAAIRRSSDAARGSEGALRDIGSLPFGEAMLISIGFGLIAYGIYALINARYRRIRAA